MIDVLVRAVIEDDGCFLIAHAKGAKNTFLPGGHVEAGEAMTLALVRELNEELGVATRVGGYLGAVEQAFEEAGVHHHAVNHCFAVSSPELRADRVPESREPHLEFFWVRPSQLEDRNLQPAPLCSLLSGDSTKAPATWWASTLSRSGS